MMMSGFIPNSCQTYSTESRELATVKGKFVFEVSIHIDNSPAEILITRPSKESSLTHNIS
jgi:hypothetical protein